MKKEVSIVLSPESKNFRKLAQEWFGLSDEQMKGRHVHHNPPRHQGGRNIPEHLFVYDESLHAEVHRDDFVLWASRGGKLGGKAGSREKKRKHGEKCRDEGIGFFSPGVSPDQRRKWNVEAGKKGAAAQPHEIRVLHGKRLARENAQFEDPDHPELGTHNAGNLVRIQKSKGLPHGKENRRRVA
jgi:hypothetical protein